MKAFIHTFRVFVYCLHIFVSQASAQATFSGTKTIGGAGADYSSINAAVTALKNGVVVGPVTFNIRTGTYNEKVSIPAISGVSSANTVTFRAESGNASDVRIVASGSSNVMDAYTIQLKGATFIKLSKLTVCNTGGGTSSVGIHLLEGADNDTISDCIILLDSTKNTTYPSGTTSATASFDPNQIYGIAAFNTSAASPALMHINNASFTAIIRNTIRGGTLAINLHGTSSAQVPHDNGSAIIGNTIIGAQHYGLHIWYNDITEARGNKITLRENQDEGTGIYLKSVVSEFTVSENTIMQAGQLGIGLTHCNSANAFVTNNMIGEGFRNPNSSGIYIVSCTNIHIYHNSVYCDGPGYKSKAFGLSTGSNYRVKNNIFSSTGYAYYMPTITNPAVESDYNVLYTTGPDIALIGFTGSTPNNYPTLDSFRNQTGMDDNSMNINPYFLGSSNLHTFNKYIDSKGTGTTNTHVSRDIDGELRDVTNPDIGADEFTPHLFDISLIVSEPLIFKPGNNSISITLRNDGVNSLAGKTATFSYSVDGGGTWSPPEPVNLDPLSATYTTFVYTFSTLFNASASGTYTLCIRINDPATIGDNFAYNNQLCAPTRCVGLAGIYAVGTGQAYPTLQGALDALVQCGMGDHVIFELSPGVYSEQLVIGSYKHNHGQNNLIIRSATGKPQDVVITKAGGGTETTHYTVRLNGAKHVTIQGITIQNTHSVMGSALHITNGSDSNIIRNCILIADKTQTSEDLFPLIWSSPDKMDYDNSAEVQPGSYNLIENCTIRGGYASVYMGGGSYSLGGRERGNHFRNNKIVSGYKNGIWAQYQEDLIIEGNEIRPRTDFSSQVSVFLHTCKGAKFRVTGNKLFDNVYFGLYFYSCEGTPDNPILIANNMIAGGFNKSSGRAFQLVSTKHARAIHNTIYYDTLGTNSTCAYFSGGENLVIMNNIFYHSGNGYAYQNATSSIDISNYNALYTGGAKLVRWGSTDHATLSALQDATGNETNSLFADPLFIAPEDLHIQNVLLTGKALYDPQVPVDADRELRDTLGPTIGADELPLVDLAVLDLHPKAGKKGSNIVSFTIVNRGAISLKDSLLTFSYSGDEGFTWTLPETVKISGLVGFGSQETFSSSIPWDIQDTLPKTLCVRISGIKKDANKLNDSLCSDVCISPSIGGAFTIGGTNPDFPDLNAAVAWLDGLSLMPCGIAGPLTFEIRPGIYNEQIMLNPVKGASVLNTVTFRSSTGNAGDVLIKGAGGDQPDNFHIILLKGTSHIIFKDITVENTGVNYAAGFYINQGASENRVENCIIRVDSGSVSENLFPILISRSFNNTIQACTVSGGYFGIALFGKDNNLRDKGQLILDNRVNSSYAAGIRVHYNDFFSVSGNVIRMRSSNSYGEGIFLSQGYGDIRVTGNTTSDCGSIGIHLENIAGANAALIANNMLGGGFSNTSFSYGLYMDKCERVNICHNSINYDLSSTILSSALYTEAGKNLRIHNNIFANSGDGYAFYVSDTNAINTSDYNALYTAGITLAYWDDDRTNLSELQGASGRDLNSMVINPGFKSAKDLHLFNAGLDQQGLYFPGITEDIDKQMRDTITPDIGADEFTIGKDGGVTAIDGVPGAIVKDDPFAIKIMVSNYGNVNISNFPVMYTIDGANTVTETFTSVLAPGSVSEYLFNQQWTPTATGTYEVCARTVVSGDVASSNDPYCGTMTVSDPPPLVDAGCTGFSSPPVSMTQGEAKPIKVNLKNYGTGTLYMIPVQLLADKQTYATDTFNGTLNAGATTEFTFSQNFQPLLAKTYLLEAFTKLPFDVLALNDTASATVNVYPVGIETREHSILIYPNPAEKFLRIKNTQAEHKYAEVIIRNVLGMACIREIFESWPGEGTMDIASLKPGIYELEWISGNERNSLRFIRK